MRIPLWINKALNDGRIVYAVAPTGERMRITRAKTALGEMFGRDIGGDWWHLPEGTLFDGAISNGKETSAITFLRAMRPV